MHPKLLCWPLVILTCLPVFSQSPWTNYVNDRLISDVLVSGNNVWVGSQGGLTKTHLLTGDFQTFLPSNSPLRGGGIVDIEKAPDNSMWFSSENAGVFQLKNNQWTQFYDQICYSMYHHIIDLQVLSNGDVWFLVEQFDDESLDRMVRIRNGEVARFENVPLHPQSVCVLNDSTVFISAGNTIQQYNPLQNKVIKIYDETNSIINEDDRFYDLIADKHGKLIIGSPGRILQIADESLSVLSSPGLSVLETFKDGIGNVFLQGHTGGSNGIRLIKYDGTTIKYMYDADFTPYPVMNTPIFMGADSQGGLYAKIFDEDSEYYLYRFFEGVWTPVRTQIVPMRNNYQDDVEADCEGNLWFGSRDGVDVRYADGRWEHFGIDVLPHTTFGYGQMAVDPVTCDVWVTNLANSGSPAIPGLIRISNGIITPFLMGHDNVHDVEVTDEGKVYFFSLQGGFGYIENDEIHYVDPLVQVNFVTALESDSKGNVYLAAWDDKLYKYDGQVLAPMDAGEFPANVYGVYVDNDDLLWVHFSGGVKVFDGATWVDYSHIWPVGTYNGIVQDHKGNYWVSTWNDGLYYWDRQTLQQFTIFNSDLTTNKLRSVALDPDGNLIVTQHVGASVLSIPNQSDNFKGTGKVFFDEGKDGLFTEGTDLLVPGQKIWDEDRDLWAVSNIYGKYTFYTEEPGTSTYHHQLEEFAESTTENPQEGTLNEPLSVLPDFGFWKPRIPDVDVSVIGGVPVCNRPFSVYVVLHNNNVFPISGHLSLRYNAQLSVLKTSIPYTYTAAGLLIFEDLTIEGLGTLIVRVDFQAPGITSENTNFLFDALFDTSDGPFQGFTTDTLLCSYDPNDKKVEPTGDFIPGHSLIADPLKYTIRFQNEGTYKAFDITIIDTLESNLDPSTFQLIASSHVVETTVTAQGIVTFFFRNIDLPARSDDELGSQGFVTFTVKPDSTLYPMELIENTASIYFDFNPPILTNLTQWNVVDKLETVGINEVLNDLNIYPNPTTGMIFLNSNQEGHYQVWDITGRPITAGQIQLGTNRIVLDAPSGIYHLHTMSLQGKKSTARIVVMR